MFSRGKFCFLMIIILSVLLIPACGDGNDNTSTPTATATPTVNKEPVKIAAINIWSGSAAMSGTFFADPVIKVVEKQVEERGGILGGRPLKITKYDGGGTVSGILSAATKATLQDKHSVLVFGGTSVAESTAIAEVACEKNAFYSSTAPLLDTPERECIVEGTISFQSVIDGIVTLITEQLQPKPQTVAILAIQAATIHTMVDGWKSGCESAGIKTIYEQIVPIDTADFTSYLTRIKYADPDVLILYMKTANYMALAKQIMELGGWGDIQVVGDPQAVTAAKMPGAKGWLTITPWYLKMVNPESIKFVQDYEALIGKSPDISHIYFYFSLWTAIHAIELAGTAEDGKAIAKAARSGKLEFDTPMGPVRFNADGRAIIRMTSIRIGEGGKLVPFE